MNEPLLAIRGLRVSYDSIGGEVRAVNDVDLEVRTGEWVGIAGESGCGKTTLALAIGHLLAEPPARYVDGSIRFAGRELMGAAAAEWQSVRGSGIAYIFQEPASSLNPVLTIGSQIAEVLTQHRRADADGARREALELLERVGIADAELRYRQYPHQLSGGLLQRAMIAMALAGRPRLLIADEPTSALDVTVQSQIVELLRELRSAYELSLLCVSHDLELLFQMTDRVGVMYAGRIVEWGATQQMRAAPAHPYTQGLMRSLIAGDRSRGALPVIVGEPPTLSALPSGCPFHPRCPVAEPVCAGQEQSAHDLQAGHWARCWKVQGGRGV